MKTINELHAIVGEKLEAAGFKSGNPIKCSDGSIYGQSFAREGDTERTPAPGRNYTLFNGKTITAQQVHRHNGTEENTSLRVDVTTWHNNSGRVIYRGKITKNNGDKKISSIIAEAIAAYETL